MKLLKRNRAKIYCCGITLFFSISCFAQILHYYPFVVFFNPCGYTNSLPGCNPDLYTTFSSVKLALNKELLFKERLSNSLSFVGNLELYHNITKARDYNPISLNPALRTHFFANDIFTPGLELTANIEFFPGIDLNGNTINYTNYRFRVRPFHYLIMTPNIILEQIATFGISKNSDGTRMQFGSNTELIFRDYYIIKYEAKAIYLTPFRTRVFFIPYCFFNQFEDMPARSADGSPDINNPKLRETGFGCAFGLRYSTNIWGYTEGAFEFEKNIDEIFDANSYYKLKFNFISENQFLIGPFGYFIMFEWIKHISESFSTGFIKESNLVGELGQQEIRVDIMPIFNLNRNVSIRPEFDFIYRKLSGNRIFKKFRYQMHLHVYM